ncbi:hypothetical protein TWF481_006535 [Arthrobotrys musiformis]|uniref:Uncharacterized protein n=1 Tax=Arthrobotrys musiformis TaxID=47236 RepID=A0AAV9WAR3_9PEZI
MSVLTQPAISRTTYLELPRVTPPTLHLRSHIIWFDRSGNSFTLDREAAHAFIYDSNVPIPAGCIYYMVLSEDPTLEDFRLLKSRFSCPSELDRRFHSFNSSISHRQWKGGRLSEIGAANRIDFYVQYNNPSRLSAFVDETKTSSIAWLSRLKAYFLASSYPLVDEFEKHEEKETKTLAQGGNPTAGGRTTFWTMRRLVLSPYLDRIQLSSRLWRKGIGNASDGASLWYSKHSISLCRVSNASVESNEVSADLYLFDQFSDWIGSPIFTGNGKLHRVVDGDAAAKCLSFVGIFKDLLSSPASATRNCGIQGGPVNLRDYQIAKMIRMACFLDLLRIIAAQLMGYIDNLNFQATRDDLAPYDAYREHNNLHLHQIEAVLSNLAQYASYLKRKLRLPHPDFGAGSSSTAPTRYQMDLMWLRRTLSNLESDIESMRSTVASVRTLQDNGYQSRSETRQRQESRHIRKLAILATIFLPLSLSTGLLSMQTRVSELGNLLYDYVGIVVTLAWILMFYFAVDVSRMKGTALMFFPHPKAVFFVALCVAMVSFQFGMWWGVRKGWMSLALGIAPLGFMVLLIWIITKFFTGLGNCPSNFKTSATKI